MQIRTSLFLYFFAVSFSVFFLSAEAKAQQYPSIQPGYWTVTDTSNNKNAHSCLEAQTPQKAITSFFGTLGSLCVKKTFKKISNSKYLGEFSCNAGPASWNINSLAQGDFQKEFKLELSSRVVPEAMSSELNKDLKLTAKFNNKTCPKGLNPGELAFPDGRKVNINTAAQEIPKNMIAVINQRIKQFSTDLLKNLSRSLQR